MAGAPERSLNRDMTGRTQREPRRRLAECSIVTKGILLGAGVIQGEVASLLARPGSTFLFCSQVSQLSWTSTRDSPTK